MICNVNTFKLRLELYLQPALLHNRPHCSDVQPEHLDHQIHTLDTPAVIFSLCSREVCECICSHIPVHLLASSQNTPQ